MPSRYFEGLLIKTVGRVEAELTYRLVLVPIVYSKHDCGSHSEPSDKSVEEPEKQMAVESWDVFL